MVIKDYASTGYYGVLVVVLTISTQAYTATLLSKCWLMAEELEPNVQMKKRYPYSTLAQICLGKWMSYFTTLLLDTSIFVAGVPNLIVGK